MGNWDSCFKSEILMQTEMLMFPLNVVRSLKKCYFAGIVIPYFEN